MTPEATAIDNAHEAMVMQMYRNFFDAYSGAKGNADGEKEAQANFVRQVGHAVFLRDRAKGVL